MSPALVKEDFCNFFKAVNGGDKPFPWQQVLAERVFTSGWPSALDVPTAAGKTAAIDIAIFHLALQADRGLARDAPVRIAFVVDRRLVVDSAHKRAQRIATALAQAKDGVLALVSSRLRLLAEEGAPPLSIVRLRGGVPKEPDWVRTPAQPTVILSTVDQIGSRLLFRGYGVKNTMRSLHAGLLGCDTLLLLDEAHLSQPFVQTLRDSRRFQENRPWSENTLSAPFAVVTLSATQDECCDRLLTQNDLIHPILGPRLKREKPATLIEIDTSKISLANAFGDTAHMLSKAGGGSAIVVAIVVNRVARAREIFNELCKRGARPLGNDVATEQAETHEAPFAEIALLLGRSREFDREAVLQKVLWRIEARRPGGISERPLIVVATQCIEAGTDFDFDALVTEIAPLDCLRQRFGRLNRIGRDIKAQAVIIATKDQVAKRSKADPIYGLALKETWALLNEKSKKTGKGKQAVRIIDFGVAAAEKWLPSRGELTPYLAPRAEAPILLPRDVTLWSRTSPPPAADPEVALYLHGPDRGSAEVEIIWRADIDEEDFQQANAHRIALYKERIAACPPSSLETLSVPIWEVRRWLCRQSDTDVADVEGSSDIAGSDQNRPAGRPTLRWKGADDEETSLVWPGQLSPGDRIIVPSIWGGCDQWGWAPESAAPVRDWGREANWRERRRDVLRLTRASPELGLSAQSERELADRLADASDRDVIDEFERYLRTDKERQSDTPARDLQVLRDARGIPVAVIRRLPRDIAIKAFGGTISESFGEAVSEDDESLRGGTQKPIMLTAHCKGVKARVEGYAKQLGFPQNFVEDLGIAGLLHDAGKAHPAFQRLLYGGAELAAMAGPLLAKSTKLPTSQTRWREAQRRARLPRGSRHEVASLAFAETHPLLSRAHDRELVLWLIATHHGYGRPFFPPVDWPDSQQVIAADLIGGNHSVRPSRSLAELTAAWIDLFARVQRRYGPWGLARLEAMLRLADHRQSEAEQEAADEPSSQRGEAAA